MLTVTTDEELASQERAINDALSPEAKARMAWVPDVGHHVSDDELWAHFEEIWDAGLAIVRLKIEAGVPLMAAASAAS